MSNNIRTRNGLPFNFEDGLKSKGKPVALYLDTVAQLRGLSITSLTGNEVVELIGFTTVNDGSGCGYYWNAVSTANDDNNTVIKPTSNPANGRWIKINRATNGNGGTNYNGTNVYTTTAGNGQTVFDIPNSYTLGNNSLAIFINGLRMFSDAYTETDIDTVTFNEAVSFGAKVMFITGIEVSENTGNVVVTQTISSVVATLNQTVFTVTNTYVPGTNSIAVFLNGLHSNPNMYVETDGNTITFHEGVEEATDVLFVVGTQASAGSTEASLVSYIPVGGVASNVFKKLSETVSVKDFGAVGDGITDDTVAIQAAIDSGANIVNFLGKTYLVNLNTLTLNSNQTLDGNTATLISTSTTRGTYMFKGTSISNLRILNFTFQTHNSSQVAIWLCGVDGAHIYNNKCVNACLMQSTTGIQPTLYDYYGAYPGVNSTNQSSAIIVENNILVGDRSGIGDPPNQNHSGITIAYSYGSSVRNNIIDGYIHGIMWWGGNANPVNDGIITNARKVISLNISGNVCTNIALGAIWGSMGYNVQVNNNTTSYSGDVEIDFEGCINCSAIGNTVYNRTNGGLGLGFLNRNIKFSSNYVFGDTSGTWLVNQFSGDSYANSGIVYSDNDFIAPDNCICFISGNSMFDDVSFISNRITNTYISMGATNGTKNLTIEDNKFTLTWNVTIANTPLIAISGKIAGVGGASTINIRNNYVVSKVKQDLSVIDGIYIPLGSTFDTNKLYINIIKNDFSCLIRGWNIGATDTNVNAANVILNISDNLIPVDSLPVISLEASGNIIVNRYGNNVYIPDSGAPFPYPYNIPTDGKWFVGEKTYTAVPLAGGNIGYVCTATGIPGTWKSFGAISA